MATKTIQQENNQKICRLIYTKRRNKRIQKIQQMLKDSASHLKMEWLYVNRLTICIVTFIASIILFAQLHSVAINYIYTEPTTDYNIIGDLTDKDRKKAMEITEMDNYFLDMFRGKLDTTTADVELAFRRSRYYEEDMADDEITETARRIVEDKLAIINTEYLQWFEILLAIAFALVGYMSPIGLLMFQVIMRKLEMEDEVMQFQTIILMLMRIERVNVEIILDWLERYSNIFRPQITRCVNNYEAGAWEAGQGIQYSKGEYPALGAHR